MSTEPISVATGSGEKRIVLKRVGNSVKLKRTGVAGCEEIHVPVEEVGSVADLMVALAEE